MPDHKEERKKKLAVAIEKATTALGAAQSSEWPALLERFASWVQKLPAVCADCDERLEPRIRDRCPKHAGIDAAKTWGANKIKEHGPAIVMKTMSKAAEALDKWLGDPNASASEEDA